jgi:sulfotransferase
MIKRVFYNASFPRSGSTLLQNVLGQNPDIFPSPTSGMFTMMLECRNLFTNHILFQAQNQDELLPGFSSFLKNGINGYYSGLTDKPYAIDKFRGWHGEYNFVNAYDPNPKIVVMVRDLRSIFSSMEKKYRANPLKDFNVTDYKFPKGNSVITRIDDMAQKPMLDLPLENLWQCIIDGNDKHIHFIKFEDFCKFPTEAMEELYEYLELPYYEHDFNNIEQITHENDQVYGPYADHTIRKNFTPPKEDYINVIGEHASNYIYEKYQWFYKYFNYSK